AAGLPPRSPLAGGPPALQSSGASQKRLYNFPSVDPHHCIERLLRVTLSDRPEAGKAWEDLKHMGIEALPYLLTRVDSPEVTIRAKTEELIDIIGTNSVPTLIAGIRTARNDDIARLCCFFLARFGDKTHSNYADVVRAVLP